MPAVLSELPRDFGQNLAPFPRDLYATRIEQDPLQRPDLQPSPKLLNLDLAPGDLLLELLDEAVIAALNGNWPRMLANPTVKERNNRRIK